MKTMARIGAAQPRHTTTSSRFLPLLTLIVVVLAPIATRAEFTRTISDGEVTITGHSSLGGLVFIPATLEGLPVTRIGEAAFANSWSIAHVAIPESVRYIGSRAFQGCRSLKSFAVAAENPSFAAVDGVLIEKARAELVQYPPAKNVTNYNVPEGITSIRAWAFDGCENYADSPCAPLARIRIPDSVSSIGEGAFNGCPRLQSVEVGENNAFYSGRDGVLLDKAETQLLLYPRNRHHSIYTIPAGVTSIPPLAFARNYRLAQTTIPAGVKSIGERAFEGCSRLERVQVDPDNPAYSSIDGVLFNKQATVLLLYPPAKSQSYSIPDGVVSVGDRAFSATYNLTNITFAQSVRSIGEWAFQSCSTLARVSIPEGVERIGDGAFSGCSQLSRVDLPARLLSIGNQAFAYCAHLEDIILPEGVVSIGAKAFAGCASFEEIRIPDSVRHIGADAFLHCPKVGGFSVGDGNSAYSALDGVLFDKSRTVLIQHPRNKEQAHYAIPEGVEAIGPHAFASNPFIRSVVIPDTVLAIGEGAFQRARWTEVAIPGSVASIGAAAFAWCDNLASVRLGEGLATIGPNAFHGCGALTHIAIPDSVVSLGKSAFEDCRGLERISLGNGVAKIVERTFLNCSQLGEILLPAGLESIGDHAFAGCPKLRRLELGNSVVSIGKGAFDACASLEAIEMGAESSAYASVDGVLFNKRKTELLKYPAGKVGEAYVVADGVVSIGRAAFAGCTNLKSVMLPTTLGHIGDWAFANSFRLQKIVVPPGVSALGEGVFNSCSGLLSLTLPANLASIGNQAFQNCGNLAALDLPKNLVHIGDHAFASCAKLWSVKLPPGVTTLGLAAFADCSKLQILELSEGLAQIGQEMFMGCGSLQEVAIPGSVVHVGARAFAECVGLRSATIGNGVVSIGDWAFANCRLLPRLTIPDSVRSVGAYTFYGCTALSSVTFGKQVAQIGNEAFTACVSLGRTYFHGDAPRVENRLFWSPRVMVYYQPGTKGWGSWSGGGSTREWNLRILPDTKDFNVWSRQFTINIVGAPGIPLLVEQSGDLLNPAWARSTSLKLDENGVSQFIDQNPARGRARFYRFTPQ